MEDIILQFPDRRKTRLQALQKRRAAFKDVGVGLVEVAGVPRVGDVAFGAGERQQFPDLPRILRKHKPPKIGHVVVVHPDEEVVFPRLRGIDEPCTTRRERDALCQ